MDAQRHLIVTADDFGIGPETSRGIVELAAEGIVTCTVLLVNSPHAESAVRLWHRSGAALEVGWHPALTLDRPILPAGQVPSLVDRDGRFWPLGGFLRRLLVRQIRPREIEAELRAQYERFIELVGHPPTVVNSHHHVQVFPPVGEILHQVLARCRPLPYLRRVREPWTMLARVPGARVKRAVLSLFGRGEARHQVASHIPGNDYLAGITDPPCVADSEFFSRWLVRVPGKVVELGCHPGHLDKSLIGRDCTPDDGHLQRRVRELQLLREPSFCDACQRAGFKLVSPAELFSGSTLRRARVA